jgi:hypothetical protein
MIRLERINPLLLDILLFQMIYDPLINVLPLHIDL